MASTPVTLNDLDGHSPVAGSQANAIGPTSIEGSFFQFNELY